MRPTVAVTGATGFIGAHVVRRLCADGRRVRILARRPVEPARFGTEVEAIQGSLDDEASLRRLVAGATAVVHLAGLIRARSRADFLRANAEGVARLAAIAAGASHPPRFVLMSSLAAREPDLSDYAASKRAGEDALIAAGDAVPWSILRPPAVYGPGDRATLPFFRAVRYGVVPMLGTEGARLSLIHVEDLANAVAALLATGCVGLIAEVDDGRGGYSWREMIRTAADAFGRRVRVVRVPLAIPYGLGLLNQMLGQVAGYTPMLTPGKAREIYHHDWTCDSGPIVARTDWRPAVSLRDGFTATIAWYREQGWL